MFNHNLIYTYLARVNLMTRFDSLLLLSIFLWRRNYPNYYSPLKTHDLTTTLVDIVKWRYSHHLTRSTYITQHFHM
ncbi:hypothetical protein HanXRQr2_Chr07g0284221 [Helianthus annuus]|uniref:Uncharacterized protein n=1 Tax=Helianthus annuus TaxID=4232 RepID=A0A9K3NF06_HELAN|nr:hypothetical protein HanXRQr2_Chr07g0284221 [Helianthus annuus]KAJ0903876.1 hypothetical protein HanPSC8_Chr07g0275121 [Helianthus annuus]